jgi:peptidoglycan/xylan/chitin deacetylase (PgdA/CDA1 family)
MAFGRGGVSGGRKPRLRLRHVKRAIALAISLACLIVHRIIRTLTGWRTPLDGPIVLTYHAVTAAQVQRFTAQMRELHRHAVAVAADCVDAAQASLVVAVTFDDAFHNVFEHAAPVMEKYAVPFTVFVPTASLGLEPAWIAPERRSALGIVAAAEVIAAAAGRGVQIGSHTVTHPYLAHLNAERLQDEMCRSRETLEQITGRSVTLLALPYGSYNAAVLEVAATAGYERVYANVPLRRGRHHPILVGRIDVSPDDSMVEFGLKMRGAYSWLALAIPAKRRLAAVWRSSIGAVRALASRRRGSDTEVTVKCERR